MPRDTRGLFWKKLSKEERSRRMSAIRKAGWEKIPLKERQKWSRRLNRRKKELST